MTQDTELIQLFDRYHLKQVTPEEKQKVDALIEQDPGLKEVFSFRKDFISAVRQNEREELLHTFRSIETNLETESKTPVVALKPLKWAVAAVVIFAVGISVYWKVSQPSLGTQIVVNPDTLKSQTPSDTLRILPQLEQQIAHKDPEKLLRGLVRLPYYESTGSLGFSKDDRPSDYAQVIFYQASKAEYEYGDTLKIYLSTPLKADRYWKIVYEADKDLYHLTDGKADYPLVRDQGRKPFLKQ